MNVANRISASLSPLRKVEIIVNQLYASGYESQVAWQAVLRPYLPSKSAFAAALPTAAIANEHSLCVNFNLILARLHVLGMQIDA